MMKWIILICTIVSLVCGYSFDRAPLRRVNAGINYNNVHYSSKLRQNSLVLDFMSRTHSLEPSNYCRTKSEVILFPTTNSVSIKKSSTPIWGSNIQNSLASYLIERTKLRESSHRLKVFYTDGFMSLRKNLKSIGVKNPSGPSIIFHTVLMNFVAHALMFRELVLRDESHRESIKNQLSIYQAIIFIQLLGVSILRGLMIEAFSQSFLELSSSEVFQEPFLWIPSLDGPNFGSRNADWLLKNWKNSTPPLGWKDSLAYLSVPVALVYATILSDNMNRPTGKSLDQSNSQYGMLLRAVIYAGYVSNVYYALHMSAGLGVFQITNILSSSMFSSFFNRLLSVNDLLYPSNSNNKHIRAYSSAHNSIETNMGKHKTKGLLDVLHLVLQ